MIKHAQHWLPFCLLLVACSSPQSDFKKAEQEGTLIAYRAFLQKHSQGPFADQARARITAISEEQAWRQAEQANTLESYQAFATLHQDGSHAAEARDRIVALQRSAAWEYARSQPTPQALQ